MTARWMAVQPKVRCGNPLHPAGAWHPAAPLATTFLGRWRQRRNVKQWGCRCER